MTSQSREKYTITVGGKILRTPSTGSIQPEHMKKHPVTTCQYQGKCITTALGNVLKMLFIE